MNKEKREDMILSLIFVAFFLAFLLTSMTYSPKARRMPLVVGIPGLVLAGAIAVKIKRQRKPEQEAAKSAEGKEDEGATPGRKKLLMMIGWMVLLVGMIWMLGFLITIPLYTLFFMKTLKESWRLSIIVSAAGFVILYLIFVVGINVELYPGLLFNPY